MAIFENERIWRIITNTWTIIFLAFIVFNFFKSDAYDNLAAPLSALYIGVLTLYVGTKEFDRWYDLRNGRHPGEIFVIIWTVIILGLFLASFFLGKKYNLAPEVVADYIAVLSIFAITQKSKRVHKEKMKKNEGKN